MIFFCFLKVGSSNSNSIAFVVVNLSFFFSFPVLYPCPFCKIVYLFFYLGIQNVKSSSLKGGSNTWKWVCIIFSFFSFVFVSSAILCRKIDNRCILSCSGGWANCYLHQFFLCTKKQYIQPLIHNFEMSFGWDSGQFLQCMDNFMQFLTFPFFLAQKKYYIPIPFSCKTKFYGGIFTNCHNATITWLLLYLQSMAYGSCKIYTIVESREDKLCKAPFHPRSM